VATTPLETVLGLIPASTQVKPPERATQDNGLPDANAAGPALALTESTLDAG